MQDEFIINISQKIRLLRKEQNLTMQELADRSGVTKGLISQIENNHTVPSLPALINIIQALDLHPGNFFKDILPEKAKDRVFVFRAPKFNTAPVGEKELSNTQQIFSKKVSSGEINVAVFQLHQDERKDQLHVKAAFEYQCLLQGKAEFYTDRSTYILEPGDSILMDQGASFRLRNLSNGLTLLLQIAHISPFEE